jgi:hypothetical protein
MKSIGPTQTSHDRIEDVIHQHATRVLNEILLLSCMATFVTRIVVAAASVLT